MARYIKKIESGNLTEIYEYQKPLNVHREKRSYTKNKRGSQVLIDYRNSAKRETKAISTPLVRYRLGRSISRARQSFFRLVSANLEEDSLPALATFTCYENLSLEEAYKALKNFFTQIRASYPRVKYIAVPEWQKRGTIHFHALVWGIDPKAILHEIPYHYRVNANAKKRERYLEFCVHYGFDPKSARGTRNLQRQWARGFFDIVGATDNSLKIAGYMAKYLAKGLADARLSNNRAYSSSHNVKRPRTETSNADFEYYYHLEQNVDKYNLKEKTYATLWLGMCKYQSYQNSKPIENVRTTNSDRKAP